MFYYHWLAIVKVVHCYAKFCTSQSLKGSLNLKTYPLESEERFVNTVSMFSASTGYWGLIGYSLFVQHIPTVGEFRLQVDSKVFVLHLMPFFQWFFC